MHKKIFTFILITLFLAAIPSFGAENKPITKANYKLPARFTPNKMEKMVFSTSVDAHWLKHSNRFWYVFETTEGKTFNIVDPGKRQKRPLFDNIKMAANLTKLTKDPYEAKHLPIEGIKFIKNDRFIYFKVPKNEDLLEWTSPWREFPGPRERYSSRHRENIKGGGRQDPNENPKIETFIRRSGG